MTDPTDSERLLEAVELLRRHNLWRRCDDGTTPFITPGELGVAIDTVVELVPPAVDDIDMLEKAFSLLCYNPPAHMDCAVGMCSGCRWRELQKRMAKRVLTCLMEG